MEEKFTVEEFRKYAGSQDSLGDVLYFLNAENIRKANQNAEAEDCLFYEKSKCLNTKVDSNHCTGKCDKYE